jgi:hypothetical protein
MHTWLGASAFTTRMCLCTVSFSSWHKVTAATLQQPTVVAHLPGLPSQCLAKQRPIHHPGTTALSRCSSSRQLYVVRRCRKCASVRRHAWVLHHDQHKVVLCGGQGAGKTVRQRSVDAAQPYWTGGRPPGCWLKLTLAEAGLGCTQPRPAAHSCARLAASLPAAMQQPSSAPPSVPALSLISQPAPLTGRHHDLVLRRAHAQELQVVLHRGTPGGGAAGR